MKDDIKTTVANNLIALRKSRGLTQADVANALNYSDKSVSKWEHADSLPDISILCTLCDMYGITLDYLTHENAEEKLAGASAKDDGEYKRNWTIAALSMSVVFLIATIAFIYCYAFKPTPILFWQAFLWAIPANALILLYHNRKWFKNALASIILKSVFLWSLLACVFVQFFNYTLWLIFILGIPIEFIIVLSSNLTKRK